MFLVNVSMQYKHIDYTPFKKNIYLLLNSSYRKWEDSLVPDICRLLADELPLPAGSPGGMETYRRTLTTSFFFKFYLTVQMQLQDKVTETSI